MSEDMLRCDALGCNETHPLDHEMLGEPSFGTGRWLGWVYLDLNRPDLFPRELRFCSVRCCQWWLDREVVTRLHEPLSPLDVALRRPYDMVARKRGLASLHSPSQQHISTRTLQETWNREP